MAFGVLGLLGLGLAGVGVGGWGSKKIDENIKSANNSELLFNKDDNVGSANEIVNKQTDPNVKQGKDNNNGQLNAEGTVDGHSAIQSDINGDPNGASLYDVATQDDNSIVQGAKNQVEPHKDPITGMEFDSYDAFIEWKEDHPFIYGWRAAKPFQSGKLNPFFEKVTPEEWQLQNPKGTKSHEWNEETQSFDTHYGQKRTTTDADGNEVVTYENPPSAADLQRQHIAKEKEKERLARIKEARAKAMSKLSEGLLGMSQDMMSSGNFEYKM